MYKMPDERDRASATLIDAPDAHVAQAAGKLGCLQAKRWHAPTLTLVAWGPTGSISNNRVVRMKPLNLVRYRFQK
jgi:hypothetical protein